MKEFVSINGTFFLNLAFRQVGGKNYGKDWYRRFFQKPAI